MLYLFRKRYRQPEGTTNQLKDPVETWEVVATDLFTVNRLDYLLVLDFYSRYPEIEKLENTSSAAVIFKSKSIFARHGTPAEVVSDNGPQYTWKAIGILNTTHQAQDTCNRMALLKNMCR